MRAIATSSDLLQVEQALLLSEARRQALLDSALDCIICADAGALITDFNLASERTFRISRSDAIGKEVTATILHPELQERLRREFFAPALPGGVDIIGNRLETRCQRADGSEFPAEITVTRIAIERQTTYTIYVRDITARRRAEEALVRLAAIVESSQDAIIANNLDCVITSWNKGAERMFGYTAREVIGRNTALLGPATRAGEFKAIVDELKASRPVKNLETTRKAKNGAVLHVSLCVSPILDAEGKLIGAASIARDITAQKLAEEALRRASETSIYASPIPIIAADNDSNVTMWNPAAEALFGWSEGEVIGKQNPIIPAMVEEEAVMLHQALLSGQILRGVEVRRQKRDGTLITVSLSAAPIRDAARNVKGILGFLPDISKQKKAEEALRQAEEKYRTIFENAMEGIYQSTPDGRYIAANPALARMLGFDSAEELISVYEDRKTQEFVRPERYTEFVSVLEQHDMIQNFEYEAYRKDGRIIWVSGAARAIRGPDNKIAYFEGTIEDTTHRRELEQQLRQMQKIEAIGRLAGGVAHDFNNILMAISSYGELLDKKLTDSAARRYAAEIVKATERGSALTHDLLTFSRKQMLSAKVIDVNEIIKDQISMLRRLIPENIELEFLAHKDLGRVKADPSQMQQVLMNLIINARDAMANGGRLVIETGNAELDGSTHSRAGGIEAGNYVMVAVSDNGCGMSAEVQSHIFEPFFTTKEQGKGTGLGLAIVFGIVKQSGGYVFVQSEPNIGTTFKIYFPQVDAEVLNPSDPQDHLPVTGTETILLVEDEDGVRDSAAEYLRQNGYTVLTAKGGPEALELVEKYSHTIHLLLTDLVMPRMSGRELSEKMASRRPQTEVLYMSGYSDNVLTDQQPLDPRHGLIHKPFRLAALGRRVREKLGRSRAAGAGATIS